MDSITEESVANSQSSSSKNTGSSRSRGVARKSTARVSRQGLGGVGSSTQSLEQTTSSGLEEGSVVHGIAHQIFQKEAKKFKDYFGKEYSASATISLFGKKYRFISDDPIFTLVDAVDPNNPAVIKKLKLFDVVQGQCPCCNREMNASVTKKMVNC